MVGITLHGRFGNQMFQYAFGKKLAQQFDTNFFLDEQKSDFILNTFFEVRYSRHLNRIKRKLFFFRNPKPNKEIISQEIIYHDLPKFKDSSLYEGFFQSKEFFSDVAHTIQKEFTIKKHFVNSFKKKYPSFIKKDRLKVVMHVRRTDYISHGNEKLGGKDISLPSSYYLKALSSFNHNNCDICIIGDDTQHLKSEFGNNKFSFELNEMIIDFQLLLNADICIISNSSFAWWAAYLNPNKNKKIIAPKHWLGYKSKYTYPIDIMSKLSWKWIENS